MNNHPTGTVTFLFTDIEGSTKLAHGHPDKWEALQQRHHAILQSAMDAHNGFVFQIIGDAFCVAFHTASDGLNAAIEVQRNLQTENWDGTPVKVRMGLHTGAAELRENDYHGYLSLVLVQRVMSAAYGGQVLLSNATVELIHHELPEGITLRDMKEHRLKGLLNPEHLWQILAPGLQQDFPPLQSLNKTPNNLPIQLTSFIGRENEVGQIKQRLEKNRIVTLTGSGGIGKTRLSIQVASELLTEYPNGAWLVELAPLADPSLVTQAVCTVLDVTPQGGMPVLNALTDYLRAKNILLVLDNCEHLIDACAQLCESLLHVCPDLRIIASSREALGIEGENAYRVPSLSLPNPKSGLSTIEESDAVKLFMERATAMLPEFEITEFNASAVAQICQRLDGIALAIELAASRVKMLKVEQIAARLDDAFRLLTGGSRTALPRQQTLRALIDWSYNLLSEEEPTVLRSLSVFMGGWTLEAAEAVCDNAEILDLLTHLVDKSLVAIEREHGDEVRYYLLETIRQYAREKLAESGESEAIRERHARWCVDLAERAEPNLRSHDQIEWLDRKPLAREVKNRNLIARVFQNMGEVNIRLGKYPQAKVFLEESLAVHREAGNYIGQASALSRLGRVTRLQDKYEQGVKLYAESLQLALKNNRRATIAWGLVGLAELAALLYQPKRGARLLGTAEAMPELYISLWPDDRLELEQASEAIHTQLNEADFETEYEAGKQITLDEAVAYALKEL